jgi:transposase InsO family protein
MLSDNGSAYTARETRTFARQLGHKPCLTPVRSPQSNGISEAYVHTLKKTVKVGLHCLKDFDSTDEQFLQQILPEGWSYRASAKDRRTIEREFERDVDPEMLANQTEQLKRMIRRTVNLTS